MLHKNQAEVFRLFDSVLIFEAGSPVVSAGLDSSASTLQMLGL